MGKKNRRRNTNKKTGTNAASALVSLYSASSGTNPCYHGSTADKFQPDSEYMKAVEEYVDMINQICLLDNQDGSRASHVQQAMQKMKYEEDHRHLMKNPEFCRFIFAICTQQYLKSNNFKAGTQRHFVQYLLLGLGSKCRYGTTPKIIEKYLRDGWTERGVINILFRETTTHCPCMNEAKDIAKSMDKEAICNGCNLIFPKKTLRPCTGCQKVDYHNRKCQKKHWPTHKVDCKSYQAFKLVQEKFEHRFDCKSLVEKGKSKIEQMEGELLILGLIFIVLFSYFCDFDWFWFWFVL